jgi:crotonobetainyl-CoA:carnitine CoA-transferase CaiB-like acyl-CoA transferase
MPELPLKDLKILDFMWVLAGPGVTRMLADYGATVVRIESTERIDPTRTVGPFQDDNTSPEYSALWGNNNAGKYSLTLDLSRPKAREVVFDLVRWADAVGEAFSPKAMRNWGFDYESLRKIKPDIIMLSTCLMGQTGPLARFAGFGNLAAALCGFYNLVGWPDRSPSGPFSAYTDYIGPRFATVALMAALIHRKRTGQGQYIDLSQAESALHFLTVPLLDTAANGRDYRPVDNYDPDHAPHGVYPAAGDDRWVAIACRSEDQWRALCHAMKQPNLAADTRFERLTLRQTNRAELDKIISQWTAEFDPRQTEQTLQAVGVPAYTVQTADDMWSDPQLHHRRHFVQVPHAAMEKTYVENSRFQLSRTPAQVNRAGPTLGEHNEYVLATILGYDEERITDLVADGALG